ncbi:hypothetical protein MHU86_18550 [Fragilaria crotonensis]|nr:hypothetical protein MHU86_18550 [Fragilaria crotonensis]
MDNEKVIGLKKDNLSSSKSLPEIRDGVGSLVVNQRERSDRVFLNRSVSGNDPPVYERLKLCKRGHREAIVARACGVVFEGWPFWLWTIRLAEWSEIHITDTDEVRLRQYHFSTWEWVRSKLVIMSGDESSCNPPSVVLWLVSGTLKFLRQLEGSRSTPMVGWMSDGGRRKPNIEDSVWNWTSVAHIKVGGVTKAVGMFCTAGLGSLVIPEDPIRRSIGHIIKYSVRPTPCNPSFGEPHYTVADHLSMHKLHLPVVFSSGFSRTGWGQRPLVAAELAHAFDLPSFIPWETGMEDFMVPLQMFRVVLDGVVGMFDPDSQAGAGQGRRKLRDSAAEGSSVEVVALPLDRVWIPQLQKWLPGSWTETAIAHKAVKSDNATVDFHPWNQRIMLVLPCRQATIAIFEEFGLRRWKRGLVSSFLTYLRRQYGVTWADPELRHATAALDIAASQPMLKRRKVRVSALTSANEEGGGSAGRAQSEPSIDYAELDRDIIKGRLVLQQLLQSKWWEWSYGSALIFWRWNGEEQRVAARDGMRSYILSSLPVGRKRLKKMKLSQNVRALVEDKIEGMKRRYYLESVGHVSNSLDYFAVPKGDEDIRVVFDGTSCGLNDTLWAPNFFLPSASSAAMLLTFQTWMSDMDFGEMFHNFPMEEKLRRCSGVEVETKSCGGSRAVSMLRWTRLFMGMRPSPYNAVRYYYWGEEFARGDPSLKDNPMGYDSIRLNLPGMSRYDPLKPKVMKWRSDLSVVAGDVLTFVDDVRITGFSKENCHKVHRHNAGAWTGTIFKITPTVISKSVSQEKWNKGKAMVKGLVAKIEADSDDRPVLDRKQLEKETGFLNHLAMTFDVVTPFLKGFYLTMNSWRTQRDEGDWKMTDKRWKRLLFAQFANDEITETELDTALFGKEESAAPHLVKASISLASDVGALAVIFAPTSVPVVGVRSKHVITVVYGFGDASGTGLGATFTCGSGLNFRIGVWGSKEDPESSNWKEFTNVVESLEEEGREGNLDHSEVFMFTDNSTVESCVSRGSSTSPKLLELVVRLQALSMRVGIKINVIHIAGTRMIAQGTDGVSRGFLGQGVMDGEAMSAFVPVHLSAVERSAQSLVPWIREWAGRDAVLLKEMGWFEEGHDIEGWICGGRRIFATCHFSQRKNICLGTRSNGGGGSVV